MAEQPATEPIGFWLRAAAFVLDFVLVSLTGGLISALLNVPVLGLVFFLIYFVVFTGTKGQTPGKMALGIQVVDANGNIPGLRRAFFREVPGKLISAVPLFLGFASAGWDDRKRGWHDHIAGTYTIQKPGYKP